MTEHLLHDADVHALLVQQGGGGAPGVLDHHVANLCLAQDGLPRPPVPGRVIGPP
jgi:hypothetical protein